MILTPQQLWKDYDRMANPLSPSLLLKEEKGDCVCSYYYFNGDKFGKGYVRILGKLYENKNFDGIKKSILVFDDIENGIETFDPTTYIESGYSVLVVDYAGQREDTSRFTIYPKTISQANYFLDKTTINDVLCEATDSCYYIYATLAFRSIAFLESLGYEKNFILGIGHGGEQVWKCCYFENLVIGGGIIFSGGADHFKHKFADKTIKESLSFLASLDSSAYANFLKSPIYMQVTSNEQNSSLDHSSDLYKSCKSNGSYFSISARSNRVIALHKRDNILMRFNSILHGLPLPSAPKLKASNSDGQLYYNITIDDSDNIDKTELFVAYSQENSAFRNWRKTKIERISETDYISKLSVFSQDDPIYAFVNVRYKDGFCFSSYVDKIIPADMSIIPATLSFKRRIYDSDMGKDDWIVLNSALYDSDNLLIEKGAHDIEGITSPTNSISTFKLADRQFSGQIDSILQLSLYSFTDQEITFSFMSSDAMQTFSITKEIFVSQDWTKLNLSLSDFKSQCGSLLSWDKVLTFEITSKNKLLINSLLWV